jgi:predicted transposase/invertase (TIGR01784 family)
LAKKGRKQKEVVGHFENNGENAEENNKEKRLLPLKSDVIFKMVFGDDRNKSILRAFLTAVLDLPEEEYADIKILDPHLKGDSPDEKLAILDVQVKTTQGKRINVEIQIHQVPFMKERITGYTGKMLGAQLKPGEGWEEIKKVINIAILNYNLIRDSSHFHNKYVLHDPKTNSFFTDILEIHTLELQKFPKESLSGMDEKTRQQILWLRLIKAEREEEVEMLATENAEIEKAYHVLKKLSADEDVRRLYEYREKSLWDQQAREHVAHSEGMAKGMAQGVAKGVEMTALNLLKMGLNIEQVAQGTGLAMEVIRRLQNQTDVLSPTPVKKRTGRPPKV